MWKYHHCYGYIINRTFHTKKLLKWNGLVVHCCAHSWNIFQHSKRNFVSPRGHVISSIYAMQGLVSAWVVRGKWVNTSIDITVTAPLLTSYEIIAETHKGLWVSDNSECTQQDVTKYVSDRPVRFVTQERFAVLFFLLPCYINSLLATGWSDSSP